MVLAQYALAPLSLAPPPDEHVARFEPQVTAQVPPLQTLPDPHFCPQAPQLPGSVCRSAHRPLHTVCPPGQVTWQVPATHTQPALQALPQVPQLAGSVAGSTQACPHCARGAAQDDEDASGAPPEVPLPTSDCPVHWTISSAQTDATRKEKKNFKGDKASLLPAKRWK